MTTESLEVLAGTKLTEEVHVTGVLRTEPSRTVLNAQAGDGFVKPGALAVVVDLSDEPNENFKRFSEARFLAHENIARSYLCDWLDVEGRSRPFIVLEHPDAVLGDVLQSGPISGERLLTLIKEVLGALAFLHSENLVYGALSVNSIWRVGERWQLTDFSQLRVPGVRPTGETRRLLISREIAAPPEAYYGEITPAWDIWSLGTLLSKIARPVRKSGSDKPLLGPVPLPAKLEQIITSASMLEPSERMTADEMLRLLSDNSGGIASHEAVRESISIPAAPIQRVLLPPPTLHRKEPRQFLPWARIVQVLGLGAAVFALSLFLTRRMESTPASSSPAASANALPAENAPDQRVSALRSAVPSVEETKLEIAALLGRWANAAREGDLGSQVNCYAPVVDTYFDRHNVSAAELRRDKERALQISGPIAKFDVSDLRFDQIKPDWAVVSFNNHWAFVNDGMTGAEARVQVVLRTVGGDWKITSERDANAQRSSKRSR